MLAYDLVNLNRFTITGSLEPTPFASANSRLVAKPEVGRLDLDSY
jgi:hypothetical protein